VALRWDAAESVTWLELSRISGTSSRDAIEARLVYGVLERLPKGIHRGEISITPPAGTAAFAPFTIEVVVDMRLPLAAFVTPYAVMAGQSGEVYLRGSGLSSLPGTVLIDGVAATTSVRDDDTQIRFVHAPLAAGDHSLDVGMGANDLGLRRSRVKLVAANGPSFGASTVASFRGRRTVLYHDSDHSFYVAEVNRRALERFSASMLEDDVSFDSDSVADVSMMPDGETLLVLGASFQLTHVDARSLNWIRVVNMPITDGIPRSIAVGNDGIALIAFSAPSGGSTVPQPLLKYDPVLETFTEMNALATGDVRAARSGSVLYALDHVGNKIIAYDTVTGTLETSDAPVDANRLSAARDGKFLINVREVMRPDRTVLGRLAPLGMLRSSALSADGTRAYGYVTADRLLHVYDLNSPNGSGGFNEARTPILLASDPGGTPVIAITTDNRRAFIAGDNAVHVVVLQ
jgi:hypothetical protein